MALTRYGDALRVLVCAAFTAAIAVTIAGCAGSPSSGAPSPAAPPLGTIPVITSTAQVTRPIDSYLPSSDQVHTLMSAVNVLQARCVRSYGLPAPTSQSVAGDDLGRKLQAASPLYGFYDTSAPNALGYNRVLQMPKSTHSTSTATAAIDTAAMNEVVHGRDASGNVVTRYDGKAVSAGGCEEQALAAVGGMSILMPTPSTLPDGGPQVPVSDPRLVAIDAQWSICMKSRGFAYPSPNAAFSDPQWVPAARSLQAFATFVHTPKEVGTMEADMACKKATNLMGVAVAVQGAYDRIYIASHQAQLADYEQKLQRYLHIAPNS